MKIFVIFNRSNLTFALAILILLGILGFALIAFQILIQSNNLVSHSLFVQETLDETLSW